MSTPRDDTPAGPHAAAPSRDRARDGRATIEALTGDGDVFETFFENADMGLALADLAGRYVRVNTTYAALVGRPAEDLIGVPLVEVMAAEEVALSELLTGTTSSVQVEQQYPLDGRAVWLLHGVASVPGPAGDRAWYSVTAQDVTERRRVEHELRELTAVLSEQAVRDPLTGLANRALLQERLRTALARDARSGQATGALFLDLDGFKVVNDRHGHAVGDTVLRVVAERLSAVVRPSDTVARIGGDEFVVLVEDADSVALDALVARLTSAVEQPVRVGTLDLDVGVSIGTALSLAGEQDPTGLLDAADARMYEAKRAPG